jgi:hypothetical protein
MSGTGSLMIRNLRKSSDYDKARLNQDDLLKIAIANDNNISNARRAYRQGEVPALTPQQQYTPDEVQADISKNYSDAITNLISLGFDYREASQIAARMGNDPTSLIILNNTFPSIKADFQKRFDVKRITPTGFIDFFDKFREIFEETKGISDNSTLFNDKFDRIINNLNDLRAILPTPHQFQEVGDLLRRVAQQNPEINEILQIVNHLRDVIPDENFFRNLAANNDNTQVFRDIAQLQNAMANLPSQAELQRQLDLARQGHEDAIEILINLMGDISGREIDNIAAIEQRISGKLAGLAEQVSELETDTERIVPYFDMGDIIALREGRLTFVSSGETAHQPLSAAKLQTWYKKNTNNFRVWYDNTISADTGGTSRMEREIKQFVIHEGTRHKIGEEFILTKKSPKKSGSTTATTLPTTGQSSSGYSSGFGLPHGLRPAVNSSGKIGIRKIGSGITYKTRCGASPTTNSFQSSLGGETPISGIVGIAPVETPSHIQFGKYLLHANNMNKSVLSVHHKGGGRVASIPVQSISDDLKDFIVEVLQNKKASVKDFNRLPLREQKLFEKMSKGAGIHHTLGLKPVKTDEDNDMEERFEVLKGEWFAGNNSHELVRELRKIVIHFMEEGRLTKSQARELLLTIN